MRGNVFMIPRGGGGPLMTNGLARRGTVTGMAFFKTEAPSPHGFVLGGLIKAGVGALTKALVKRALPSAAQPATGVSIPGVPGPAGVIIPAGSVAAAALQFIRSSGLDPATALQLAIPQFGLSTVIIKQLSRALGIAAPAGGGRRRRRMNPLNLRALGRADRRLTSFAKIARRYTARSAPQRRVRAPFRRKRR